MNPRQERFCLGILEGKPPREAYIDAGYSKKSAHVTAYQLLNNPSVKSYLAELRQKATSQRILDVIQVQEVLSGIIRYGQTNPKEGGRIAVMAAHELAMIQGMHAPSKTESTSKGVMFHISVSSTQSQSLVQRVLNGDLPDSEPLRLEAPVTALPLSAPFINASTDQDVRGSDTQETALCPVDEGKRV